MKDSKVTFRLIDFIILNIAIVAVIAVIVFNNVNNMHKEAANNSTISKEIISQHYKKCYIQFLKNTVAKQLSY